MDPSQSVPPVAALSCKPAVTKSVLRSMLGPGVGVAAAVPALCNGHLFEEERRYIERAAEKRQAEFGTARVCARLALAQLGVAACALVPNRDRSPRWPHGVRGSISHTRDCCAVAVTLAPQIVGLGIDIEEATPLQTTLMPMVCTAEERLWLDGFDQETKVRLAKLFFSAKEAFYKCQYRTTLTFIDFLDVQLDIDLDRRHFSVAAMTHKGSRWDVVRCAKGRFSLESGLIVTTAVLT